MTHRGPAMYVVTSGFWKIYEEDQHDVQDFLTRIPLFGVLPLIRARQRVSRLRPKSQPNRDTQ